MREYSTCLLVIVCKLESKASYDLETLALLLGSICYQSSSSALKL